VLSDRTIAVGCNVSSSARICVLSCRVSLEAYRISMDDGSLNLCYATHPAVSVNTVMISVKILELLNRFLSIAKLHTMQMNVANSSSPMI